jgi:hypothetical protein
VMLLSGFVMKQRCGLKRCVSSYCLGLRPIYHGGKGYDLTGYRANNAIITTHMTFFSWLGILCDFIHAPVLNHPTLVDTVIIRNHNIRILDSENEWCSSRNN